MLDKPIPILLEGESGVGKEFFARAIHDSSQRSGGTFVAINCAAIPENLIEAELFGYAAGAFTGARAQGSPGLLRQAHGGTLFLDEIGDMPLPMQTRLLRERGDFAALVQKVLRGCNAGATVTLAADVQEKMQRYHWPGNLRQLSSVLRTASAMLGAQERCINWAHLPDDIAEELQNSAAHVALAPIAEAKPASAPRSEAAPQKLEQHARLLVQQALQTSGGNVSQAARSLGISRQTLYKKLKQT